MMKRVIVILSLFIGSLTGFSQEMYTVDGQSYELKTEVEGTLDLLWNIIDDRYRYFVKKDGQITELKNTKGADRKFQEEYKQTLNELTQGTDLSTEKLKFTLYELRKFFDNYNEVVDPLYRKKSRDAKIESRLMFFGGITNSTFVENSENASNPVFGAEIEFTEGIEKPRHALFFHLKHVFSSDKFNYSNTQFGAGYRFRIVRDRAFNIYTSITAATFGITNDEFVVDDQVIDRSGSSFDAPFIFGVGADFRITDNSFISFAYDELFGLFIDTQGNFSTHITLGYKFIL